jgi:hypothetical protein
MKRYSGKRHSRELFAWLRRCLFRRAFSPVGVIGDGGRVRWTHRGRPRRK